MDRCAYLLRWLVPPLLGATLAALGWMASSGERSSDVPPPAPPGALPERIATSPPSPLPSRYTLPRLSPRTRGVLTAEYLAVAAPEAAGIACLDEQPVAPALIPPGEPPAPAAAEEPVQPHTPVVPDERPAGPAEPPVSPSPEDDPDTTLQAAAEVSPAPVVAVLSPTAAPGRRSAQLEQIARQADRHTRRGFALAERGAYFAARAEFVQGLDLIAEGLDAELQTAKHRRALKLGLTAVRESDDLRTDSAWSRSAASLAEIVARHDTPLMKDAGPTRISPLEATKCYLGFAQEQLAASAGEEVAGSMALYGLGKLHAVLAGKESREFAAPGPKAVTFFQAALLVAPQNHLAANDLGVLLAKGEHYEDAYRALVHSLSLKPQATGWHNLAVVLRNLGRPEAAARADRLAADARAARSQRPRGPRDAVEWVNPQEFARTSTTPGTPGQVAAVPTPRQSAPPAARAERPPEGAAAVAERSPTGEKTTSARWALPWPPTRNRQ